MIFLNRGLEGRKPDNPLVWSHWMFFPKEKSSFQVHCLEAEGRSGRGREEFILEANLRVDFGRGKRNRFIKSGSSHSHPTITAGRGSSINLVGVFISLCTRTTARR